LVPLLIEVPECRVHGDDEFRFRCERVFQEPVVRFVPDDTELGQRIADWEALDDFSDEFGMIAEDVRLLFEDGRADPRLEQTRTYELVDERRRVVVGREGRELQNAGVKDDSQGRAWRLAGAEDPEVCRPASQARACSSPLTSSSRTSVVIRRASTSVSLYSGLEAR
jgi:hypothetical protein